MDRHILLEVLHISKSLFTGVAHFSRKFLRIVIHFSINILQLGFMNILKKIWMVTQWHRRINIRIQRKN